LATIPDFSAILATLALDFEGARIERDGLKERSK